MVSVSVPCTGRASKNNAGAHRQHRRYQRPPEARHLPRPERQRQAGDAADQKQPAQKNRDGEARERRHDHRGQSQNHQQDALDQKGLPMLANRGASFRLQLGDVVGKGHWNSPDAALRNDLNYSVRKRRTVKYVVRRRLSEIKDFRS